MRHSTGHLREQRAGRFCSASSSMRAPGSDGWSRPWPSSGAFAVAHREKAPARSSRHRREGGLGTSYTIVATLDDTKTLVYRHRPRDPRQHPNRAAQHCASDGIALRGRLGGGIVELANVETRIDRQPRHLTLANDCPLPPPSSPRVQTSTERSRCDTRTYCRRDWRVL
jgi:hypothetical protein